MYSFELKYNRHFNVVLYFAYFDTPWPSECIWMIPQFNTWECN